MEAHYRTLSAIFPIIVRAVNDRQQVLLLRRANTGFMDGMWDFAGSGHVDENETARQAVVRECKEEIGITVRTEDLSFAHLSHRFGPDRAYVYYDIYFTINKYEGTPYIAEPDKCSGLAWFDSNCLPGDMIEIRKDALESYYRSEYYSERFL